MTTKKLLTTLPSTRHQQFTYHTIQSVPNLIDQKTQLGKIISIMKQALNFRVYLLPRDIQQIYINCPTTIQQYFHIDNFNKLWKLLDIDQDGILIEKQQIIFLTKFITQMTNKKNKYADQKKYLQFTQTKTIIEWFQQKIIQYEKILRQKIKQLMINKANKIRQKKNSRFSQYSKNTMEKLIENQNNIQSQMNIKIKKQKINLQKQLALKITQQMYKIKPSLKLSKTKDISLLAKLAPYKNQKKRAYECQQLEKNLSKTLQLDIDRQNKDIMNIKKVQHKKLDRKQEVQWIGLEERMKSKHNRILSSIKIQKDQLDKSQNIRLAKIIQQNHKKSNQRVNWIRNSLRAYSQRQETKKIRSIMKQHQYVTQFCNDINDVVNHSYQKSPRYSTINMQYKDKNKKQRQNQQNIEQYPSIMMKALKKQNQLYQQDKYLQSGRKSLVDLYDQNLTLL